MYSGVIVSKMTFSLWEVVLILPPRKAGWLKHRISGMCQVQHMALGHFAPSCSLTGKERWCKEVGKGVSPFKQV